MGTAYVLINCDLGSEQSIMNELKLIPNIKEITGVFGVYDIIAKIEAETANDLREIITWKIRKIKKIRSTLTLMAIQGEK